MNIEEKIFNEIEVVNLIKDKLVFISINYPKKIIKQYKDLILIIEKNTTYKLSVTDFLDLYKNTKYIIYDENEEIIDNNKDIEYYSIKHK